MAIASRAVQHGYDEHKSLILADFVNDPIGKAFCAAPSDLATPTAAGVEVGILLQVLEDIHCCQDELAPQAGPSSLIPIVVLPDVPLNFRAEVDLPAQRPYCSRSFVTI
jgi:hypothetical protein